MSSKPSACWHCLLEISNQSVHSFLRILHSIWYIGAKLFKIPWTNFFDDFLTFADHLESTSIPETVHCLFRLLGWRFAEGGAKASPFNKIFCALGVNIDVESVASGEVLTVVNKTLVRQSKPALKVISCPGMML